MISYSALNGFLHKSNLPFISSNSIFDFIGFELYFINNLSEVGFGYIVIPDLISKSFETLVGKFPSSSIFITKE